MFGECLEFSKAIIFIVFFVSIIISNIAVFSVRNLGLKLGIIDKYEKRKRLQGTNCQDRWRFYNAWMLYINLSLLIPFRFSI